MQIEIQHRVCLFIESIREVLFDGLDRELAYQQSTLKYELAANQQFPYNL